MENENKPQVENTDSSNEKLLLSDVMQQRELLLSFIQWWINNNKRRDVKHTLEEIIDEFIKTKQ